MRTTISEKNQQLFNQLKLAETEEERKQIKEAIFKNNVGLASSCALSKSTSFPNFQFEDLKQVALWALWKAIDAYDESRDVAFSTFVRKCIFPGCMTNAECWMAELLCFIIVQNVQL